MDKRKIKSIRIIDLIKEVFRVPAISRTSNMSIFLLFFENCEKIERKFIMVSDQNPNNILSIFLISCTVVESKLIFSDFNYVKKPGYHFDGSCLIKNSIIFFLVN